MEGSANILNTNNIGNNPVLGTLNVIPTDVILVAFSYFDTVDLKTLREVNKGMNAVVERECKRRIKKIPALQAIFKEQGLLMKKF